ncbi:hypothetical protein SAMN04488128_10250 [Chitinophaga eiseniae]|uniref:Uncharacterized protein n=1 Tax=Chitinophaga eiseniae TaxID=634771 RepID=A0A1T4PXX4_9BACT|nr:hypothetical protein [Chitinophaga eiseniae]SJZ96176.1 hypothetical protein SAMN04488128_10250 [Chitinophaga eiseniae]
MAEYSLSVQFTQAQLDVLYATGSNVVVAKPTGGSAPNVAWQVFRPMRSNKLSWGEEYGIYASTSKVQNGAKLDQLSSVPVGAAMNKLYTLEPSANIKGPVSGGSPDAYSLLNKYDAQDYMTVGLYQDATVNGTDITGNALSAAPVLLASTATMTPFTTVYIWLQSQVLSNTVVTLVTSPMTQLKYGDGVNNLSVAYDSASGKFLSADSARHLDAYILHLEPVL